MDPERVRFTETNSFRLAAHRLIQRRLVALQGELRISIEPKGAGLHAHYLGGSIGRRLPSLRSADLEAGSWLQLVFSNRLVMEEGWFYQKTVINLGLSTDCHCFNSRKSAPVENIVDLRQLF